MVPRVRLAGAIVQLQVFLDDGDTLEPIQVNPIPMTVRELASIDPERITKELARELSERLGEPYMPDDPLGTGEH